MTKKYKFKYSSIKDSSETSSLEFIKQQNKLNSIFLYCANNYFRVLKRRFES